MPELSERAILMPSSPIRKLAPFANDAKARGLKVYHLNIGQPDLNSPEVALEAIKNFDRKILEYSPSDGFLSLREKLVGYYDQYQIKLTPDDIIVTSGGSEAVLFAFLTCLNPGDEIIVPEPAYANYMAFAISAGAVIRPIRSSIDESFALPPMERFEELSPIRLYREFWQDMLTVDDLKWLYTALTRATEKVYLVNFKDDVFAD
jgi:aspartate aminotransferase